MSVLESVCWHEGRSLYTIEPAAAGSRTCMMSPTASIFRPNDTDATSAHRGALQSDSSIG